MKEHGRVSCVTIYEVMTEDNIIKYYFRFLYLGCKGEAKRKKRRNRLLVKIKEKNK